MSIEDILLDTEIRDYVLLPIMGVMVLVGLLRHYLTLTLSAATGTPKSSLKAIREAQALIRAQTLRQNANIIPKKAFENRKLYLGEHFSKGTFLKIQPVDASSVGPDGEEVPSLPPQLQDPAQMEAMMDGMKKNMMMLVPQMIIMGWVNAFFSGFVVIKLPFPLTLRFKSMLQSGILTQDMDVAWVSSLSWYFVNLFGLKGIYSFILGQNNTANQQVQAMVGAPPPPTMATQDMSKVFASERDGLELVIHEWRLDNAEAQLVDTLLKEQLLSVDGGEHKKFV